MSEIKTIKNRSLGESLDILRECTDDLAEDVKELYGLDEDNFLKIKELTELANSLKERVVRAERHARGTRRRLVFGFVGIGGLLYFGKLALDAFDKRIAKLEDAKASEDPDENPEKAEESDG